MGDAGSVSFAFPSSTLKRKMGGGYDRDATEALFEHVASSYEDVSRERAQLDEKCAALQGEIDALRRMIGELETELDRYQEDERLLGAALMDAKRSAAAIKDEARHEAETIVKKARARAASIVDKAVPEAQARAREIISGAEIDRARLDEENARIKEFTDATNRELSSFLDAALAWQKRASNGEATVSEHDAHEGLAVEPVPSPSKPPTRRISLPRISSAS